MLLHDVRMYRPFEQTLPLFSLLINYIPNDNRHPKGPPELGSFYTLGRLGLLKLAVKDLRLQPSPHVSSLYVDNVTSSGCLFVARAAVRLLQGQGILQYPS